MNWSPLDVLIAFVIGEFIVIIGCIIYLERKK